MGITHQLALPLRVGDGIEAYGVSRPDDDYDDAELAGLVRPAVAALVRQHRLLADVVEDQYERARGTRLTEREFAVLTLLGSGPTAVAIARRLHTSPRTVHKHLEHLYRELGVRDGLMAVRSTQVRAAGVCGSTVSPLGHSLTPVFLQVGSPWCLAVGPLRPSRHQRDNPRLGSALEQRG